MSAAENPRAAAGDNSQVGGIAVDRLRSIVERVERLTDRKAALQADIKDIFTEARSAGFDVRTIRVVLRDRKMDRAERDEQELLRDTYRRALDLL